MKILIVHHLEMTWESGYKKFGESFESLAAKTIHHITNSEYDRVILTQFDTWKPNIEHNEWVYLPDYVDMDIEDDDEDSDEGWERLIKHVDQWESYGYGWELEQWTHHLDLKRDDKNDDWIGWKLLGRGDSWGWGGTHSEIVMLDDWIKDLKGHDIFLAGAFDGECIEDMEYSLDALEIPFNRVESIIL